MTKAAAAEASALSDTVGGLADLLRDQFLVEEERGRRARASAAHEPGRQLQWLLDDLIERSGSQPDPRLLAGERALNTLLDIVEADEAPSATVDSLLDRLRAVAVDLRHLP